MLLAADLWVGQKLDRPVLWMEQRRTERVFCIMQMYPKPLLATRLLIFEWPKTVTRPNLRVVKGNYIALKVVSGRSRMF